MVANSIRTSILVLLSLLIGGNAAMFPPVSYGDDNTPLTSLFEKDADSDDVEELSGSKLVATIERYVGFCNHSGLHAISDEVNHQIDWLFVHEHAARAPPLG